MDVNYWYLGALVLTLVYVIPVLVIRMGINKRKSPRRLQDRRMAVELVDIDRRAQFFDRRTSTRRA